MISTCPLSMFLVVMVLFIVVVSLVGMCGSMWVQLPSVCRGICCCSMVIVVSVDRASLVCCAIPPHFVPFDLNAMKTIIAPF